MRLNLNRDRLTYTSFLGRRHMMHKSTSPDFEWSAAEPCALFCLTMYTKMECGCQAVSSALSILQQGLH